ncbi:MAG: carboxypeptidase regulatory-like domain-containing protein [Bacteroidetes bacterium]|nr:carboxypeptidase regulatory-like domain-containing protein [Bacteroidota bacterium]
MTKQSSSFVKLSTALLIFLLFGCSKNSSTPLSPPSQTSQPKGTITGLVKNRTTDEPVAAAKISLGYNGTVQSTTSDSAGAFSFADVSAGQYQVVNGVPVFSGSYTVTVSLVNYNSSQTDTNKKYRNYYYSTVTITFTSLGQGDSSAVNGMVGSILLEISYLNTTVKGQVVDLNMQPVQNALVTLYDATAVPVAAIAQTTTASDGSYQFTRVDNGLTVNIEAVSQNGSLQGALPFLLILPANVTTDSLRSEVSAERIMLTPVDDTNPYVINITPENNSDVSPTNLQIVYTFSEPIKQTAYTRTDLPPGDNTLIDDIALNFLGMKKSSDAIGFSAQWNSSFSQLTITPQGLVGSARYSLDMTRVFNSGKIMDTAGNLLVDNPKITGDFEVLQFTTSGNSPVPGAPTLSRRLIPGYFPNLDFNGGVVGLEWNYDPNARSYNIYKSIDGSPFQLLRSDFYGVQFSPSTGSLVVPLNATNPLSAGSVSYLVRAVSKDLVEGSSSNTITVTDGVNPRLPNATVAAAGGTNNWTYTLYFSEPLNISTAENINNYLFTNTGGITFTKTAANYIGFSGGFYVVQLSVSTSAAPIAGYMLVISGVTDLAGNGMDQTENSRTF